MMAQSRKDVSMPTHDPGGETMLWLARALGAVAGSAISLAYVLPRGRRDAAIRFMSGTAGGFMFGTPIGIYVAEHLAIADKLTAEQTVLMGAGLSSLLLWWAIGVAMKASPRLEAKSYKGDRNER